MSEALGFIGLMLLVAFGLGCVAIFGVPVA